MTDLWKGRPLDDLTRDELLEAIRAMARMHQATRRDLNEALMVLT